MTSETGSSSSHASPSAPTRSLRVDRLSRGGPRGNSDHDRLHRERQPRSGSRRCEETVTVERRAPIVDTRSDDARDVRSRRSPAGHAFGARPVGHAAAHAGHRDGPREHRRQPVGPAVGLHLARRHTSNNKWTVDGVDITDMAATGASPVYYDFDMLQEMQVTTGGADASQQTGGVGINFVTKSGTNSSAASGRYSTPTTIRVEQRLRGTARRRAPARASRSRTSRTSASRSAARSSADTPGTGAATASRTSRSASSASTRNAGLPSTGLPTIRSQLARRSRRSATASATDLTTLDNYNLKLT